MVSTSKAKWTWLWFWAPEGWITVFHARFKTHFLFWVLCYSISSLNLHSLKKKKKKEKSLWWNVFFKMSHRVTKRLARPRWYFTPKVSGEIVQCDIYTLVFFVCIITKPQRHIPCKCLSSIQTRKAIFLWLVLLSLFLWFWLESHCWLCALFFLSMKMSKSASLCLCVHLLSDPFSVSRVCYLIHSDLLTSLFILLFKYSYSFPDSLLFSFIKHSV